MTQNFSLEGVQFKHGLRVKGRWLSPLPYAAAKQTRSTCRGQQVLRPPRWQMGRRLMADEALPEVFYLLQFLIVSICTRSLSHVLIT